MCLHKRTDESPAGNLALVVTSLVPLMVYATSSRSSVSVVQGHMQVTWLLPIEIYVTHGNGIQLTQHRCFRKMPILLADVHV